MDSSLAPYQLKTKEEMLCALNKLDDALPPSDVMKPENRAAYAEKLARHSYMFVAGPAEAGDNFDVFKDEVYGFVTFYANDQKTKNAHATFLATSPKARRMGVGSGLMGVAIQTAIANGMETMTLEIARDNEPIYKLHSKRGFRVVEEIANNHYRMFMRLAEE